MRSHFAALIFAIVILHAAKCPAADDLAAFYTSLRAVFAKHYPAVVFSAEDKQARFEHRTQVFMIHEPLKTGEWQEAREQRGPRKGGIYCEIVPTSGPYVGAAAVPQTFDKRYFRLLLLAPYSKRLDQHLYVRLSYPADASNEFLREFTEVIKNFSAY
jgi:hypothetical protein